MLERRNTLPKRTSSSDWIFPLLGKLAKLVSPVSCLYQRNSCCATKSDIPPLAVAHDTQHPALGTGRIDDKVEAIAIAVAPRCLFFTDKDGRQTI